MDSKVIDKFLTILERETENAVVLLKNFIKLGTQFIQNSEELLEDMDLYEGIYQVYISDLDFYFWIKLSNRSIEYAEGKNNDASINLTFTKDLLIKVIKRETSATDAYMRGLLKINGSISQAFRIRSFLRKLQRYFERYQEKK